MEIVIERLSNFEGYTASKWKSCDLNSSCKIIQRTKLEEGSKILPMLVQLKWQNAPSLFLKASFSKEVYYIEKKKINILQI